MHVFVYNFNIIVNSTCLNSYQIRFRLAYTIYGHFFYSKSLDGRRTTDFVHFKTIHDFPLFALIYLEINKLKSLTLKVCFIQIPRQLEPINLITMASEWDL